MTRRRIAVLSLAAACLLGGAPVLAAAPGSPIMLTSDISRTVLVLTSLSLIPAILIGMTSFIRIVVVLAMIRHAFGMPETPPNAVILSLALFLTAFSMAPTFEQVNERAVKPVLAGQIGVEQAMEAGSGPFRDFMLSQTRDSDIESIYAISDTPLPSRPEEVSILKLAPAFMLNELRVSFTIGFVVLLPFLLIDLVVSSILLSLGMMMVPPSTISLPVKLLMFVLIDGWRLVIEGVLGSFG
ncbi:flagellar type III secretion system pore protein FliP [Allosphingosinicella deserti]|uniref:Flagellar biosynthetic protein FliP n=1 Tax=Allosphingosinicella deserti TaxID=2116704 RepID=A0A2P7QW53_9SPHN|nr:flagellar type III secretion system pore protein FliP [Sphingomonas deserti]PSJ42198.1 flagellar biosynthetic protein FliP [Sphingomonas deserti]